MGLGARAVPALSLAVAALFLVPAPAMAFNDTVVGFTGGQANATVSFSAGTTDLPGPSFRVPADATVTSGSLTISGTLGNSSASHTDTSASDFAAGTLAENLTVSGGTAALARYHDLLVMDASNAWGGVGGSISGFHTNGSNLVADGNAPAFWVTDVLTAPTAGWGSLLIDGYFPPGTTMTFEIQSPTYVTLVGPANLTADAPVPLDSVANPRVRLRVDLDATFSTDIPYITSASLGQRTGDFLFGAGANRTQVGGSASAGAGITLMPDPQLFSKYSGNPVVPAQGGTYYSSLLAGSQVMKAGSEYWMYFDAHNCGTCAGTIGRAVSTDLTSWTVSAAPVLNLTASSWDSPGLGSPYVMANPVGSGYLMYYGGGSSIGLATSPDGVTWTKFAGNPVLRPTAATWDADVVAAATVLYNAGTWTMYYHGRSTSSSGFDFGKATSTDGQNWTKYASNPILTRGPAGSLDSQQVWQGDVIQVGGVFHLYYSCGDGSQFRVCLATSQDGTSWTRLGLAIQASAAWESSFVHDPTAIYANGLEYVFYTGESSTWQIGRADSLWHNATMTARVDFGAQVPARLDNLTLSGTFPGTSQVTRSVRSSANGVTWSNFENLPANGTISTTAANRFVEWRVVMNATLRTPSPVFRGAALNYTALAAQGRFVGAPFVLNDSAVAAAVTVAATKPGNSTVAIELSGDGGSTWASVTSGVQVALPAPTTTLMYRLTLRGNASAGPTVDAVTVVAQTTGLPADVALRLGAGGSPFYTGAGTLTGAPLEVQVPPAGLNAILAAARAANGSATDVDVQLFVTSAHFGSVEVYGLQLNLTRPNPIFATFDPAPDISVNENGTIQYSLTATSPYAPLNITWTVDGAPAAAAGDAMSFNFTPTFDMAGPHVIGVVLENGDTTLNHTWDVTVVNVNRPPVVTGSLPASPATFSHTAAVSLSVQASDPDAQALAYEWQVDGVGASATGDNVSLTGLAPGTHHVAVTASDGALTAGASWTLTITDAPPMPVPSPVGDQFVGHGSSMVFAAPATDADGDAVTYAWKVDGAGVAGSSSSYNYSHPPTGTHTVEALVSAAGLTVSVKWNLTSTNAAPQLVTRDPTAPSTVAFGASMAFNITVSDPDGDALTAVWTVDGNVSSGTAAQFSLPTDLLPGDHLVKYTATDPDGKSVEALWGVTVEAPPPPPPKSPGPGAWMVLAAMAAVAVAAALRRKGQA